MLVLQGDALRLDRDTALSLQIHGVQHLGFHFSIGQSATTLDKAIGQGRFAMVDVGDNREISDVLVICHAADAPDRRGRSLAHTRAPI